MCLVMAACHILTGRQYGEWLPLLNSTCCSPLKQAHEVHPGTITVGTADTPSRPATCLKHCACSCQALLHAAYAAGHQQQMPASAKPSDNLVAVAPMDCCQLTTQHSSKNIHMHCHTLSGTIQQKHRVSPNRNMHRTATACLHKQL